MKDLNIQTTVERYTYGNGTVSICVKTREMNWKQELVNYVSSEDEIEKMKQTHKQFFINAYNKQIEETEEWRQKKEKEAKKATMHSNEDTDDFSEEDASDDFKIEED